MAWLERYILKLEVPLSRLVIPGFQGVPLWDVLRFVYLETQQDSIQVRAASVAFNTFLSLFPSIIVFFQVISFVPLSTLETTFFDLLEEVFPRSAYFFITDTIKEIIELNASGGHISIGFILAFYFASNGISSLLTTFQKRTALIERRRSFIRQKMVAFMITFMLLVIIIVSITGIIGGQIFINSLLDDTLHLRTGWIYWSVIVLKWVMTFGLIFNAVSIIYYFAPAIKNKWSYFSPGSLLVTVLCIITTLVFNWYINTFGQYSLLYGSVGTAIVLMLWIYFNSMIVVIGFELNLGIDVSKHKIDYDLVKQIKR